jgi:hypothetical protein
VTGEETREAAPKGRSLVLVCSQPGAVIVHLPLEEGRTLVFGRGGGTGDPVDVAIDDALVSRRHAAVHRSGGAVCVVDLESRNGTVVGGETVRGAERRVGPGDAFEIGPMRILVAASSPSGADALVVADPAMRKLYSAALRVARRDAAVLLFGEPGVGKGTIAQRIHDASRRADKPFVRVRCGARTPRDLEEEIFGGSRPGALDLARGGTLLLGDVGALSAAAQQRLYGLLDRSTSSEPEVRLLASTCTDLVSEAAAGRFHRGLHAFFATLTIRVPPLRERKQEIPVLAQNLLARVAASLGVDAPSLTPEAASLLAEYPWPHNLQDLIDVMEYALAVSDEGRILPDHLPPSFHGRAPGTRSDGSAAPGRTVLRIRRDGSSFSLAPTPETSLARRGAIRRLLVRLAEDRDRSGGAGAVSPAELFASGWPGDKALRQSAEGRVRTAIWMLRKLGLNELLRTTEDGYLLDPAVEIVWE